MEIFLYVLVSTVSLLIDGFTILMFIRAIFSWFPTESPGKLQLVIHHMTEPVIAPVRKFLWRMGWFQGLPIDMSFMVTYLLLMVLRFALMFTGL
ncbi:MAG: YggT family protein [Clostridia bacterium]|nr:YggT family protein [Clostridia bacterium]MBQ2256600.1 YggT family protein [Clostridia bacterium]